MREYNGICRWFLTDVIVASKISTLLMYKRYDKKFEHVPLCFLKPIMFSLRIAALTVRKLVTMFAC